jgi:two-component system, NarL family, nitrate/nitrite response regulator NarL
MNPTVLVVDDAKIIRNAIRRVVESHDGFVVVAEAENGADAVSKAEEICPDVVIMDIQMPVMNGIEAAKLIAVKCPNSLVIADSVSAPAEYASELKKIGVKGFVPKERIVSDLVNAISTVLEGGTWFKAPATRPA